MCVCVCVCVCVCGGGGGGKGGRQHSTAEMSADSENREAGLQGCRAGAGSSLRRARPPPGSPQPPAPAHLPCPAAARGPCTARRPALSRARQAPAARERRGRKRGVIAMLGMHSRMEIAGAAAGLPLPNRWGFAKTQAFSSWRNADCLQPAHAAGPCRLGTSSPSLPSGQASIAPPAVHATRPGSHIRQGRGAVQ